MLTEYRHGALYVVENASTKDEVQIALKRLDRRLFLERQVTLEGQAVWCVVCDVGGGEPPMTLLEYRDDEGHPIHMPTMRIVERMQQMERDPEVLKRKIDAKNEAMKAEKRKAHDESMADVFRDMVPRIDGKVRPVLHRGQHLRRTRDKLRNEGWKV